MFLVPAATAKTAPRLLLCLAAVALGAAGCEEKKIEPPKAPPTTPAPATNPAPAGGVGAMADQAKEAVSNTADKAKDMAASGWKAMRDAAVTASESSLAAAKTAMDSASEKISRLPDMAQAPLKATVDGVKAQYDAAAAKLADLKLADEKTWSGIADSLKGLVGKLSDSAKALTDKLPK